MSEFLAGLLPVLFPVVVAAVTMEGFEKIQYLSEKVDSLKGIYKQLAVVIIAYVLTWLGSLLGVVLPTELGQLAPTDISAALSSALAFLFHNSARVKQAMR